MKRLAPILTMLALAAGVRAQIPATPPPGTTAGVEVDPIRCWWKTSTGGVRIGEAFDLSLTCAVLENEAVQVVPDQSHFDPAVASLAPFDVLGGHHPADLHAGQRRFFQYHYRLRIINPDATATIISETDPTSSGLVNITTSSIPSPRKNAPTTTSRRSP